MPVETDYFKQGQKDCRTYYTTQAYSALAKKIQPEDAMKLFWPPENEMLTQISMPRPKPRQKWIAGFKKEQVILHVEMDLKCLYCNQVTEEK